MMALLRDQAAVVVPWHARAEIDAFLREWRVSTDVPYWLVLQHDAERKGCAVTKNRGVSEAVRRGAEVVVVLDGDCYPSEEAPTLDALVAKHLDALRPQPVELFQAVTEPPSRGTPYGSLAVELPVAASMGFWTGVPDYCAVRQLAYAATPMAFSRTTVYGRYFPLCGMNLAFRPDEWEPWCRFVNVDRFDDIWMGWLWQREAYRRCCCFNLAGPLVRHARQSHVWRNLVVEGQHLQASETLWQQIALHPSDDYWTLYSLLPKPR